jgi:hypothetical protein
MFPKDKKGGKLAGCITQTYLAFVKSWGNIGYEFCEIFTLHCWLLQNLVKVRCLYPTCIKAQCTVEASDIVWNIQSHNSTRYRQYSRWVYLVGKNTISFHSQKRGLRDWVRDLNFQRKKICYIGINRNTPKLFWRENSTFNFLFIT